MLQEFNFSSTNLDDAFITSTSGTASVDVAMSGNHNWCNLLTGATQDSVAVLQLGDTDVTNKLDLPIATFCIKLEDVDEAEFGFFVEANTPFTANQKGAYFRVSGGELYAVTGDGVDETVTDIGAITTYSQYKIEFTSTQVRFYTEDLRTLRATHTTNITADDMTLKIASTNTTAVARDLRVDGLALMRLRKQ